MADSYNELFGLGSHSADADLNAWWLLQDDAASTTVAAQVGTAGTLNGGDNTSDISGTGPNGWLTKALHFDGTNDYVELDTADLPARPPWTWLARFSLDATGSERKVFSAWNDSSSRYSALLTIPADAKPVFWSKESTGNQIDKATAPSAISATTWYDLSGTFATTSGSVWVNGSETAGSNSFTSSLLSDYLTIAAGHNGTSANNLFDGLICDVVLFTRVLTSAEIAHWRLGPELVNTAAPVVSGTETVGSTLSCTTGTWALPAPFASGTNGSQSFEYQWTRSDDGTGTNEADIGGATSSTYTLVAGDSGKYIRCRVRGLNSGGFDSAADTNSNFTGAIGAGGGDPEGSLTRGKLVGGGLLITGVLV